jgi:hypothetical protein
VIDWLSAFGWFRSAGSIQAASRSRPSVEPAQGMEMTLSFTLLEFPRTVCLGELHAALDQKQLHSKFSLPNTPNSSSSTVDLLQKKGGADPQLHGFHGVPQGVLCEGMFCTHSWSWVEITHLCHSLHRKTVRSIFLATLLPRLAVADTWRRAPCSPAWRP